MASIRKDILVDAPAGAVWDAVRDVGEVHHRLAPGFVTHAARDGNERVVTFANGLTVRERIVDIDDAARRFSYTLVGSQAQHHNASMQVLDEGEGRSRIVWTTDILPDDMAGFIRQTKDQAAPIIARTLSALAGAEAGAA